MSVHRQLYGVMKVSGKVDNTEEINKGEKLSELVMLVKVVKSLDDEKKICIRNKLI